MASQLPVPHEEAGPLQKAYRGPVSLLERSKRRYHASLLEQGLPVDPSQTPEALGYDLSIPGSFTAYMRKKKLSSNVCHKREPLTIKKNPVRNKRPVIYEVFSEETITAFVEDLEKAHQYFEYKKYLRTNCPMLKPTSDRVEMGYILNQEKEQTSNNFHLLDENEIYYCVQGYIDELRILSPEYDYLPLNYYEADNVKQVDKFAVGDPIHYLLLQALEEGYVLDEKPENEFEKIKSLAPFHYHACYTHRKPHVDKEARSVIVDEIPIDFDEKDIRTFFAGLGRIRSFKTQRASEEYQTAHITYADIDGARRALDINSRDKSRKRSDLSYAGHGILLCYIPLTVRLAPSRQDVSIAEPVEKVKDVSTMYAEALTKYSEIRSYYSQFKSENGNPFKDEDYFKIGWMAVEASVNGGYTFGGTLVLDLLSPWGQV